MELSSPQFDLHVPGSATDFLQLIGCLGVGFCSLYPARTEQCLIQEKSCTENSMSVRVVI